MTNAPAAVALTNVAAIVAAIYIAEGAERARVPYGILSVPVATKAEARRVAENSVRNNLRRWSAAGRPGCFYQFMGRRWCPPSADPVGHTNWVRNMQRLTKDTPCQCHQ